jgi:hypothetical protein
VDKDPAVYAAIKEFLQNSHKAADTRYFQKSSDFLKKIQLYDYDIVFLDCSVPGENEKTIELALELEEMGKHVILISENDGCLIEALHSLGHADIIIKPLQEKLFMESIEKDCTLIAGDKIITGNHFLVHTKEYDGEKSIDKTAILYAEQDGKSLRNKRVLFTGNVILTFVDYSFADLLDISPDFVMPNRFQMLSYSIVDRREGGYIYLNTSENNNLPEKVILHPPYINHFLRGFR